MSNSKKTKSAMWGRSILIAYALVLFGVVCAGQSLNKISPDLANLQPTDQVDLLVQYAGPPTAGNQSSALKFGGQLRHSLRTLGIGAYQNVPAAALAGVVADPSVIHVSVDHGVAASGITATPTTLDYHNETINTAAAWQEGLDGTGIGVALIDSGISAVDDLGNAHIAYSRDFVNPGRSANDAYGHGTHIAGILAGDGADSIGPNYSYTFEGMAPGINIVNLRVLDANGSGRESDVIAAIEAAINLRAAYNIRVINLSLGRPVYESYLLDPLCHAVERAWAAGIFVVVAAGNEGRDNLAGTNGYGTILAPGNDPYVITVGAMNTMGTPDRSDDVPASYSSKGPTLFDEVVKPDLVAPGNLITSLYTPGESLNKSYPQNELPDSLYMYNGSNAGSASYFVLSGTSLAAPMVSGAAALLLEQNPYLTPDQLKARMMMSAFKNLIPAAVATDPITGLTYNLQSDMFTVGAGYLDIQAALNATALAPAIPGIAASPSAALDTNGNVVLVVSPIYYFLRRGLWSTSALWSSSVMWGSSGTWSLNAIWGSQAFDGIGTAGQSVMWGSNSLASQSIMWGSATLNDLSVMWGSSIMWGSTNFDAEVRINGDAF